MIRFGDASTTAPLNIRRASRTSRSPTSRASGALPRSVRRPPLRLARGARRSMPKLTAEAYATARDSRAPPPPIRPDSLAHSRKARASFSYDVTPCQPARYETEQAATEVAPEPVVPAPAEEEQTVHHRGGSARDRRGRRRGGRHGLGARVRRQGPGAARRGHLAPRSGIHHWEEYRARCEAAGKPEKWKDYYRNGHTEAKGWIAAVRAQAVNDFDAQEGPQRVGRARRRSSTGPTITDYRAALLAEEIDEIRDEMGDTSSIVLFGSASSASDARDPGRPAAADLVVALHHAAAPSR